MTIIGTLKTNLFNSIRAQKSTKIKIKIRSTKQKNEHKMQN